MTIRLVAACFVVAALGLGGCANGDSASSNASVDGNSVSSRRFKEDITYVSSTELEDLRNALVGVRLATFRYKRGDGTRHLGFILEDSPNIPASDPAHAKVDLYAYASMAVAALQVQARQLEQLEGEVDALSNEVEALTGKRHLPPLSCVPGREITSARSTEVACR